jgi:hypothetical protein
MAMGYYVVINSTGPMCLNNDIVPHGLELINIVPGLHEGFAFPLVMTDDCVIFFMNQAVVLLSSSVATLRSSFCSLIFKSVASDSYRNYPERSEGSHSSGFGSLFSNSVASDSYRKYSEQSEGSHADAYGQHSNIHRRNSSGFCPLINNFKRSFING